MEKIVPPYLVPGYEQTESYTDEDEADLKVLAQLRDMGSDLTNARHCVHYFYFPSEADANHAASDLASMDFGVETGEYLPSEPDERRWPVVAERTEVINAEVIRALRDPLKQVAEAHGGEYDGWEAQAD